MKPTSSMPELNQKLPTPLYHQIYLVLREKIVDGTYPDGTYLPGEHEIASNFRVSRVTARRAMDMLAAEGSVVRERGRGTRVQRRPPSFDGSVDSLMKSLRVLGKNKVRFHSFGIVAAPTEVAAALGLGSTDQVQRVTRVRSTRSDLPFSILTTFVPIDIAGRYSIRDLEREPLFNVLERFGIRVCRAEQRFSATLADYISAELLDVTVGEPLLRIIRTVYDDTDRAVEYLSGLFRPDRYQYRVNLSRDWDLGGCEWTRD